MYTYYLRHWPQGRSMVPNLEDPLRVMLSADQIKKRLIYKEDGTSDHAKTSPCRTTILT